MINELEYMDIEYTENDLEYIDKLTEFMNKESINIVNFFKIDDFKDRIKIKIFNDIEEFRNKYKERNHTENIPLWICGCSYNDIFIDVLSLSEYRKTEYHENGTLDDIKKLLLHEFVHSCNKKVNKKRLGVAWVSEGVATMLSHQYDNKNVFNATIEEMITAGGKYGNYSLMFRYAYEEYGYDYAYKLVTDNEFALNETQKIYNEVKEKYSSKIL